MSDTKTLNEQIERRNAVFEEAQGIVKALKSEGKMPDDDQAEKLRTLDEEFTTLNNELTSSQEIQEIQDRFANAQKMQMPSGTTEPARGESQGAPNIYGEDGLSPEQREEIAGMFRSPGEAFSSSDQYGGWLQAYPNGAPSMAMSTYSQPLEVANYRALLGLRTPTEKFHGWSQDLTVEKMRALTTSDATSAGTLINSLRRGLLEPGLVRPLTIRDLVTVIPVATDTIEYVRESNRISNAGVVEEATALTGTSGLKSEGGLEFERITDHVRIIAEWVPVTKKVVQDAGQLRGYIDQYLTYDLSLALEDEMVDGDGTGEHFLGILNQPLAQGQSSGNTKLHDLRSAKRKVRTGARTNANGIVVNPEDMEEIDLLRDLSGGANTGQFLGQSPFQYTGNDRIWGLPVIESEAVPPGTAVVADFTRAVLFDRESTNISVGTANDDFIRNIVRILAEMRAGFGVIRPTAFCIITGW